MNWCAIKVLTGLLSLLHLWSGEAEKGWTPQLPPRLDCASGSGHRTNTSTYSNYWTMWKSYILMFCRSDYRQPHTKHLGQSNQAQSHINVYYMMTPLYLIKPKNEYCAPLLPWKQNIFLMSTFKVEQKQKDALTNVTDYCWFTSMQLASAGKIPWARSFSSTTSLFGHKFPSV